MTDFFASFLSNMTRSQSHCLCAGATTNWASGHLTDYINKCERQVRMCLQLQDDDKASPAGECACTYDWR